MCEQVAAAIIIPPGNDSRVPAGVSALKACADAGVKNVVLLSVDNVAHKGEIYGGQFAQIEAAAPKGTTIIRLPFFYENLYGDKDSIAGMGKIFSPVKANAKGRVVAADDAGAALAAALEAPEKHAGKIYNVSSSIISKTDVAAAFSSALGKPVEYVQIPYESAKETIMGFGLLEWQVDGMFEIMRAHEAQAPYATFDGSKDFTALTGRSPTSLTEWVKGVVATGAFAPVLGAAEVDIKVDSESAAATKVQAISRGRKDRAKVNKATPAQMMTDMTGKVALVTGANKGLVLLPPPHVLLECCFFQRVSEEEVLGMIHQMSKLLALLPLKLFLLVKKTVLQRRHIFPR